jgi:nitrilase
MPLLRQSLYAQNINLYLAPTADGRDAWLSLMRTVGIEGRCFVVSSNMCVRQKSHGTAVNGQHHEAEEEEAIPAKGSDAVKRRNSCLTAEGFEIALPSPEFGKKKSSRRQSVFDEDGNEIVLCQKDGTEDEAVTDSSTPTTRQDLVKQMKKHSETTEPKPSFVSRGGSSIVSPFGDVLAGPQWEDEDGIIYADVDFDDCIRGRLDLDTAGSYSR